MRTRTSLDNALLTSQSMTAMTWVKVELTRTSTIAWGGETWVDLTDLIGFDWVVGYTLNRRIDAPADTLSITLTRRFGTNYTTTLSPLMSSSPCNTGGVLIQPYRKVRISTATCPIGTPKSDAPFNVVFKGRIDRWKMTRTEIVVECRSRVAELMDYWMEFAALYGADDPLTATAEDIEELIQNIIDDHYNTTTTVGGTASSPRTSPLASRGTSGAPWQLYSANGTSIVPFNTSTGAAVRLGQYPRTSIWDAISTLAGTIGYRLSYRYHEGLGIDDFVLVLEEPDRAASTPDLTLDPKLGQCEVIDPSLDNQYIRNVVTVSYALYGGPRRGITVENNLSRNKYGRRYMSFTESDASQIDSPTEATAKATAAVNDLKEPGVMLSVNMAYGWYLQLNDLLTIEADNDYFDSAQTASVVAIQDTVMNQGASTSRVSLAGLPKAGYRSIVRHIRGDPFEPKDPTEIQAEKTSRGRAMNGRLTTRRYI